MLSRIIVYTGPEVENIEVVDSTLRSVTIEWTLPKNFYIHNTVVVTLFRIEYWPENDRSLMRCFDRPSTINSTTVDLLQPNTTYKIVVIPVMGEHHGPRGFTLTVSTGPSPSGRSCCPTWFIRHALIRSLIYPTLLCDSPPLSRGQRNLIIPQLVYLHDLFSWETQCVVPGHAVHAHTCPTTNNSRLNISVIS